MNQAEKAVVVESLAGKFAEAPLTVLADYRGMSVTEMTNLRRTLGEAEAELLVAKNNLAKLAVKGTENDVLDDALGGPTVFAFAFGDPVQVAKVLDKAASEMDSLNLKGACMSGQYLGAPDLAKLAKLPGRDEVRAQLLALLSTPATQLARVLAAPAQQMVQVLEAKRNQDEG